MGLRPTRLLCSTKRAVVASSEVLKLTAQQSWLLKILKCHSSPNSPKSFRSVCSALPCQSRSMYWMSHASTSR